MAYAASINARFQAINALEARNPRLVVSVTIPGQPDAVAGANWCRGRAAGQDRAMRPRSES
jgi:hypothetical protein